MIDKTYILGWREVVEPELRESHPSLAGQKVDAAAEFSDVRRVRWFERGRIADIAGVVVYFMVLLVLLLIACSAAST